MTQLPRPRTPLTPVIDRARSVTAGPPGTRMIDQQRQRVTVDNLALTTMLRELDYIAHYQKTWFTHLQSVQLDMVGV